MHTNGGIARIKNDWFKYGRITKLPYPLNSIKEYIGMG